MTPRARAAGIVLLFAAVRVLLLFARDPFYDELYTLWMARRPFGSIIPSLLLDSGPPLYYFLARFPSVDACRWLSFAFACVPFGLLLWKRQYTAAALLAVYPAAALFAADARAYALCGALLATGIVLLEHERPYAGAIAWAAAAYAHFYAVLFFPLLLWKRKYAAFALTCVLFIPGFWLAFHQPRAATGWNQESVFAPFANISFAGRYAEALFRRAPLLLIVLALALLLAAISRSFRFAPYVLVPLVLVIAFGVAGRSIYFPLRFESVIAFPLVLWIASSVERWPEHVRWGLVGGLMAIGGIVLYLGAIDAMQRPLDDYRQAAIALAKMAGPGDRIVASGYLYLEAQTRLGDRVQPFPAEQGRHPGWRTSGAADPRELPAGPFLWIGERAAPEGTLLRSRRRVAAVYLNGRAVIARVE